MPPLLRRFDLSSEKSDHTLLHHLSSLQHALKNWLIPATRLELQVDCPHWDEELANSEDTVQLNKNRASLWLLTRECLCRICLVLVAECIDDLQNHERDPLRSAVVSCAAGMQAAQLKHTTQLLAGAAKVPVCTARAVSAPLHFLTRYYTRTEDTVGLQWCTQFKDDILKSAPWLRWDVLLPWSFLTIHDVPAYRV